MYEEKKYKYWFFYIKPEYLHLVYTEEDDSLLYAYTDNKEHAKLFKDQRDINKFFVKKLEISREEVNYLARYFTREYLIKKDIKTKTKGIGSKVIDYTLILTKAEDNLLQTTAYKALMVDIYKYTWLNPYIFDDEYLSVLNKIGFKSRFDLISTWKRSDKEINKMGENIQPDYLSTFIREFGCLLSLKKGE